MNLSSRINKFSKLTVNQEEELMTFFHREEYRKGEFLFRQGEICKKLFFVEKGFARGYYYLKSGKDITAWFTSENSFITAIDSFLPMKETTNNCELVEDDKCRRCGTMRRRVRLNELPTHAQKELKGMEPLISHYLRCPKCGEFSVMFMPEFGTF